MIEVPLYQMFLYNISAFLFGAVYCCILLQAGLKKVYLIILNLIRGFQSSFSRDIAQYSSSACNNTHCKYSHSDIGVALRKTHLYQSQIHCLI